MPLVKWSLHVNLIFVFVVVTGFGIVNKSFAQISIGGSGGAFLRSPTGATAFAMGGAGSADPVYAVSFWNPAALNVGKSKKLFIGCGYRPLGRSEGYAGIEFSVPPRVGVGVGLAYRGDPFLSSLVDEQEYPLDHGYYTAALFKLGCSYVISHTLRAGFTFSALYQRLPTDFNQNGSLRYSSATTLGGFDLGVQYLVIKRTLVCAVIKNLIANCKWEGVSGGDFVFQSLSQDTLPAPFVLGQETKFTAWGRPLVWASDLSIYAINAYFRPMDHIQAVFNNGVEWAGWDCLAIRAGLRDVPLTRDIFYHFSSYKDVFSPAITFGLGIDLPVNAVGKKFRCNFGIATDRLGAGVEQQLDITMAF